MILKAKFAQCNYSWRRFLWAGKTALNNACDPNADTVEWDPFIERAMNNSILGE